MIKSLSHPWQPQLIEFLQTFERTALIMLVLILSVYILTWLIPNKHNKINCTNLTKRPIKNLIRDFLNTLSCIFMFSLCTQLAYSFYYKSHHSLLYTTPDQYGWVYLILTFPMLMILHDTYFYWTHRLMHHRLLFRWIHKTHHRSKHPTALSAFAFSPIESVVQSAFVICIPAILPINLSIFVVFTWFVILGVIYGHNGHDKSSLRLAKYGLYKVRTTPIHHELHHTRATSNFGLWFVFWDKIMGTENEAYSSLLHKFLRNKEAGLKKIAKKS